jgi:hypothetical protein
MLPVHHAWALIDACYGSAVDIYQHRNSCNGLERAKTVHLLTPRWEGEWSTLSRRQSRPCDALASRQASVLSRMCESDLHRLVRSILA